MSRHDDRYTRRDIVALGVAAAAAARGASASAGAAAPAVGPAPVPAIISRAIPSTGEALPVVGLGTNNYSPATPEERAARRAVIERLAQLGGRVIDTAPAYRQSESVLGELIAELGIREQLFIATKVTAVDGDRDRGIAMLEESFRRLRTSRIDLMQVHNLAGVDVLMPVIAKWKQAGRIRYAGITTSSAVQYPAMLGHLRRHALDFLQVDYSIANRAAAAEVLPLAQALGVAVLINLPFGGRRDGNLFARVAGKTLPPWAAEFDADSWARFFLKYVVSHPAVTCAICGMTNPVHLDDNLGAARGRLPDADMRRRMEAYWDRELASGEGA